MKIIVNQNKELRVVGYDSLIGCKPLEVEYYIAKTLNPSKPVHCVIDNRFHLLMYKHDENENYLIYKPFDLVNINYAEGDKKCKITFNNEETKDIELFYPAFENTSLLDYLRKGV